MFISYKYVFLYTSITNENVTSSSLMFFNLPLSFLLAICIVVCVFLKVRLKPFVKFNCYQSILLGFVLAVLQLTYNLIDGLLQLLQIIPFLGAFLYSIFAFFVYYYISLKYYNVRRAI